MKVIRNNRVQTCNTEHSDSPSGVDQMQNGSGEVEGNNDIEYQQDNPWDGEESSM